MVLGLGRLPDWSRAGRDLALFALLAALASCVPEPVPAVHHALMPPPSAPPSDIVCAMTPAGRVIGSAAQDDAPSMAVLRRLAAEGNQIVPWRRCIEAMAGGNR